MNKKSILKYVVVVVFAGLIFVAGMFSQGLLEKNTTKEIFGCLSDCFLFPGVLIGGMGALSWIASEGAFDMLSYGFGFAFNKLIHPLTAYESFYEYKMRKEEGEKVWLKHWLIVGAVCMTLSVLFLVLYLL